MFRKISAKLFLTDASKRCILGTQTLGENMSIKITFRGQPIECDTAEEAAEVLRVLQKKRVNDELYEGQPHEIWNNRLFWKYVDSLGEKQKQILRILHSARKISDADLRKAMDVESNQQLAGILSGISKQASAHDIPARSVYKIENEFKSGKTEKFYKLAGDFIWIANRNNWNWEE